MADNTVKDALEMTFRLRPARCATVVPREGASAECGPARQAECDWLRRTGWSPSRLPQCSSWEMDQSSADGGKPEWCRDSQGGHTRY